VQPFAINVAVSNRIAIEHTDTKRVPICHTISVELAELIFDPHWYHFGEPNPDVEPGSNSKLDNYAITIWHPELDSNYQQFYDFESDFVS
jgi:hypothetical protein